MAKFEHIINENSGIEKSNTIFEKSKKPVKVTRDGKTFIQMREEGKIENEQYDSIKAEKLEEDADNLLSLLNDNDWDGTDKHAKKIINDTVLPVYNLRLYNDYIKQNMDKPKLDYQEDTEENTEFKDDYEEMNKKGRDIIRNEILVAEKVLTDQINGFKDVINSFGDDFMNPAFKAQLKEKLINILEIKL